MRKRSAPIESLPAPSAALVLILAFMLLAAGCEVEAEDPASGTEPPVEDLAAVTSVPAESTPQPTVDQPDYVIERVAFATNVNSDGSPIEELSVIPSNARNVFISVLTSGIRDELTFRAFWFEGSDIISQSEADVSPTDGEAIWVALGYQVTDGFAMELPHSVELRVAGLKVATYPFRIGSGSIQSILAFSTVALGTDDEGDPVEPGEEFDRFAEHIVAVTRVYPARVPPGTLFSAFLYRSDTLIHQSLPDGGQPAFQLGVDEEDVHQITYTFVIDESFIPGDYFVHVLINGAEAAVLPFTIVEGRVPTATPAPTPTPAPTSTPFASGVTLLEATIVEQLNPETGEPSSDSVRTYRGDAGSDVELIAAVRVSDLRIDDVVEYDLILDGQFAGRQRFPVAAFEEGWLTAPIQLTVPSQAGAVDPYEVLFYLNGSRTRTINLTVIAS